MCLVALELSSTVIFPPKLIRSIRSLSALLTGERFFPNYPEIFFTPRVVCEFLNFEGILWELSRLAGRPLALPLALLPVALWFPPKVRRNSAEFIVFFFLRALLALFEWPDRFA